MDTNSIDSTAITMKTHHIQSHLDTMLLFHEDSERVVASLSMAQIPVEKMLNTISQHQYLTLPRLSSQEMLEGKDMMIIYSIFFYGNCFHLFIFPFFSHLSCRLESKPETFVCRLDYIEQ